MSAQVAAGPCRCGARPHGDGARPPRSSDPGAPAGLPPSAACPRSAAGHQPVVLCPSRIRLPLRRFTELSLRSLVVLAYSEVSSNIETLFGTRDENLHVLEDGLNISIDLRSNGVEVEGAPRDVARAEQVFADYDHLQRSGHTFNNGDLGSMLRVLLADPKTTLRGLAEAGRQRSFGRRTVQPKSVNQRRYLEAIESHDMVFGIGPAGTGNDMSPNIGSGVTSISWPSIVTVQPG